MLYFLDVFPQTTSSNHLGYKDDLLFLFVNPGWDEMNDVLMFKLFNEVNFWFNSNSVLSWQPFEVDDVPCNLSSCFIVNSLVDYFICPSSKFFPESFESTFRGNLNHKACFALIDFVFFIFFLFFIVIITLYRQFVYFFLCFNLVNPLLALFSNRILILKGGIFLWSF